MDTISANKCIIALLSDIERASDIGAVSWIARRRHEILHVRASNDLALAPCSAIYDCAKSIVVEHTS